MLKFKQYKHEYNLLENSHKKQFRNMENLRSGATDKKQPVEICIGGDYRTRVVQKSNNTKKIAEQSWTNNALKARSDIFLSISPSELKHTRGCDTSRELW